METVLRSVLFRGSGIFWGLLLATLALRASQDAAYTVAGSQSQSCSGQRMVGAWMTDETWGGDAGIPLPPGDDDHWPGRRIEIRHDIIVCNNYDIDLRDSNLDTLVFTGGASLHFRANGALLLPLNTVIIMEDSSMFYTSNNSQGTLLQIGIDSVWGQTIRCIPDVHGPRVITQDTDLCAEESLLPVELVSFKVRAEGQGARLRWVTASEIQSDYFEVQRSANGRSWEVMTQVQAAGYSTVLREYGWFDPEPLAGTSYYRLRQADLDGTYEYLPIRAFKTPESRIRMNLVNPVRNSLRLWVEEDAPTAAGPMEVFLYDLYGNQVGIYSIPLQGGRNEITIPLEGQASGAYFVTAVRNGGVLFSERFVLVR